MDAVSVYEDLEIGIEVDAEQPAIAIFSTVHHIAAMGAIGEKNIIPLAVCISSADSYLLRQYLLAAEAFATMTITTIASTATIIAFFIVRSLCVLCTKTKIAPRATSVKS